LSVVKQSSIPTDREVFNCALCEVRYFRPHDLVLHYTKYHPESAVPDDLNFRRSKLPCSICGRKIGSIEKLQAHEKLHRGEENLSLVSVDFQFLLADGGVKFQCELCPFLYSEAAFLKAHYKIAHHRNKQVKIELEEKKNDCSLCQRTFNDAKLLKDHLKAHGELMASAEFQEANETSIADENSLFKCELCSHCYETVELLKVHQTTSHAGGSQKKSTRKIAGGSSVAKESVKKPMDDVTTYNNLANVKLLDSRIDGKRS
jgi:hypothetical protein